jgi:hypothetical protein
MTKARFVYMILLGPWKDIPFEGLYPGNYYTCPLAPPGGAFLCPLSWRYPHKPSPLATH